MCVIYFLDPFMYYQQTIPQPYQILKIVIHQILDLLLFVYTLTRSNIRSLAIPLCPMLAETSLIYSALHAQIFLDLLYVVIGPSTSTKTITII